MHYKIVIKFHLTHQTKDSTVVGQAKLRKISNTLEKTLTHIPTEYPHAHILVNFRRRVIYFRLTIIIRNISRAIIANFICMDTALTCIVFTVTTLKTLLSETSQ